MDETRSWTWNPKALRSELRHRGLSVSDLGVRTGLNPWALYKYGSSRRSTARTPSPEVARQIADALGVDRSVFYQVSEEEVA